jgi:hypothetical protein
MSWTSDSILRQVETNTLQERHVNSALQPSLDCIFNSWLLKSIITTSISMPDNNEWHVYITVSLRVPNIIFCPRNVEDSALRPCNNFRYAVLHVVGAGIATGYGLNGRGFFSSPQLPDRLWGPPSLQSNGYWGLFLRGVKRPEREAHHSSPSGISLTLPTGPWLTLNAEDSGDKFLRNVGWLSKDYRSLYPRR